MSWRRRLGAWALLIPLLNPVSGCQSLSSCPVPPEPPAAPARAEGGMLLKTGALQLGPGVGRDLLRLQSDGEWGF